MAYALGLIIGGGEFGSSNDSFTIKLPYKKWGDIEKNPARASEISTGIINVVVPMFTWLTVKTSRQKCREVKNL